MVSRQCPCGVAINTLVNSNKMAGECPSFSEGRNCEAHAAGAHADCKTKFLIGLKQTVTEKFNQVDNKIIGITKSVMEIISRALF